MHTQNDIHKISTANPLVYNNMGWLGDGSHRGQIRQAWTAVGMPPQYPCSTPGQGIIRHLGQLSLPSLRGRKTECQPSPAVVKTGCFLLCRMVSNTVWFHIASDTRSSSWALTFNYRERERETCDAFSEWVEITEVETIHWVTAVTDSTDDVASTVTHFHASVQQCHHQPHPEDRLWQIHHGNKVIKKVKRGFI